MCIVCVPHTIYLDCKMHLKFNKRSWSAISVLLLFSLACGLGERATVIPPGRPANFDVQTATPTIEPDKIAQQEPLESEPVVIAPLGDAPTHTPNPNAPPTLAQPPTSTPTLISVETPEPVDTPTPTARPIAATPTRKEVQPDPPLQGGDWDFEADFVPWANPYGEPCPGAAVALGWTAFAERGEFGSSCFNENLYAPNVFSGVKSQEITFDFIAANSGVYRAIPTRPEHRYNIVAYAKHDRSLVPVEMFLGVDLSGGTAWNGESVQWFPWDSSAEDTWVATEETVTATGQSMTIFIRGYHPVAEQGGKTVIDNVSVTDLGPGE